MISNNKCVYTNCRRPSKGRFAGFSLYLSDSGDVQGSNLCYKDGSQLPHLNFTITCAESGRYVIFYNERLNGVKYPAGYELESVFTELCEVIVQGKFNLKKKCCYKTCTTAVKILI